MSSLDSIPIPDLTMSSLDSIPIPDLTMSSLDSIDPKPSAPPAQAPPAAAAAEEQGQGSDLGSESCPDAQKAPDPSSVTATAAAASAGQTSSPTSPSPPRLQRDSSVSWRRLTTIRRQLMLEPRRWRSWARTMFKLAFWPVCRVFDGVGLAVDVVILIVVRSVTLTSSIVPDRVRRFICRVAVRLDGDEDPLPNDALELPISDPTIQRLYFRSDMVRICLVILAVGVVLFVTMEIVIMAGAITRYEEYIDFLKKFRDMSQFLLDAVAKIVGFYSNLKWHRAELARKRAIGGGCQAAAPASAAEQLIQDPLPPELDAC